MDIPNSIKLLANGETYKATVFLINTRDKDTNVPRLCTLIQDDHTIELSGGEEFMIVYVPVKMLADG